MFVTSNINDFDDHPSPKNNNTNYNKKQTKRKKTNNHKQKDKEEQNEKRKAKMKAIFLFFKIYICRQKRILFSLERKKKSESTVIQANFDCNTAGQC